MKRIKAFAISIFFMCFLIGATSCMVVPRPARHDNGKHKGWNKGSKKSNNSKSIAPVKAKRSHRK